MSGTGKIFRPDKASAPKRKFSVQLAVPIAKKMKIPSGDTVASEVIDPLPYSVVSSESNDRMIIGKSVNRRIFCRAGRYIIGKRLGTGPIEKIVHYLAKKEGTNNFFQLKVLTLHGKKLYRKSKLAKDEQRGKMLLHTELSLLSLLCNEPGVIQHHGMFSDYAYEQECHNNQNEYKYTGKKRKRLVLVLDCVTSHDFSQKSSAFICLHQLLSNDRNLPERIALKIFYKILLIVENLHRKNVVHRDLKLGNIILDRSTMKMTIINFCLGKQLLSEDDFLYDQRGSPAYISPDVLSGEPYKGKPSDMWALGVILYMMLYKKFPFMEMIPTILFQKIKSAQYVIPMNNNVTMDTENIVRELLNKCPKSRLTASELRIRLEGQQPWAIPNLRSSDQIVPNELLHIRSPNKFGPNNKLKHKELKLQLYQLSSTCNDHIVPDIIPKTRPKSPKRKLQSDFLRLPISTDDVQPPYAIKFRPRLHSVHSSELRELTTSLATVMQLNDSQLVPGAFDLPGSYHQSYQLRNQLVPQAFRDQIRCEIRRSYKYNEFSAPRTQFLNRTIYSNNLILQEIRRPQENDNFIFNMNGENPMLHSMQGQENSLLNSTDSINVLRRIVLNTNRVQHSNNQPIIEDYIPFNNRSTRSGIELIMYDRQPPLIRPITRRRGQRYTNPITNSSDYQPLYNALSNIFFNRDLPIAGQPLIEFDGNITEQFSYRLVTWLIRELGNNVCVVRHFGGTTDNCIDKVIQLLLSCGFHTVCTPNGEYFLRQEGQGYPQLLLLSLLLQAIGYNNSNFLPIRQQD